MTHIDNLDLPTVCLVLQPHGLDCTLILGDHDVSSYVRGVDIHAHVGECTTVQITLLARVEVIGEAGRLTFRKDGEP